MSGTGNSVRLHRVLKAPPNRVYRAFVDADAKVQGLPPYGFTCRTHEMNAVEGGSYRMSFTNFTTNHSRSGMVDFREVVCRTEIHITQENIPSAIPVELCYLGWQESLKKPARLVEPEIRD